MHRTDSVEENIDPAYEKALTAYKPWHTEIKMQPSEGQVHYSVGKVVLPDSTLYRNKKCHIQGQYYAAAVL